MKQTLMVFLCLLSACEWDGSEDTNPPAICPQFSIMPVANYFLGDVELKQYEVEVNDKVLVNTCSNQSEMGYSNYSYESFGENSYRLVIQGWVGGGSDIITVTMTPTDENCQTLDSEKVSFQAKAHYQKVGNTTESGCDMSYSITNYYPVDSEPTQTE